MLTVRAHISAHGARAGLIPGTHAMMLESSRRCAAAPPPPPLGAVGAPASSVSHGVMTPQPDTPTWRQSAGHLHASRIMTPSIPPATATSPPTAMAPSNAASAPLSRWSATCLIKHLLHQRRWGCRLPPDEASAGVLHACRHQPDTRTHTTTTNSVSMQVPLSKWHPLSLCSACLPRCP